MIDTPKELTVIYYTANINSDYFMKNTQKYLLEAVGDTPIISVSFKPTVVGNNCNNIIIGEQPRSNYMIYKQVLIGAKKAKTKYVAMAEDDMLYHPSHFTYRPPSDDIFSYNINKWSIFSWTKPPIFSYRVRKLMNSLIVTKDALVKTLDERYSKYPDIKKVSRNILKYYWGEPGRFENHLGIAPLKTEEFSSKVSNIMFSTSEALGYEKFGKRKGHSEIKTNRIEHWGNADTIIDLYFEKNN